MFDVGTHLCLLLDMTYATTFPLIIVGWWHTISWSTHSQATCQETVLKHTICYCTRGYSKAVRGILIYINLRLQGIYMLFGGSTITITHATTLYVHNVRSQKER